MSEHQWTATVGDSSITVTVNHELCSGTGQCAMRAPAAFYLEDGKAWVRPDVTWDDAVRATVHLAAEGCPWWAITVDEPPR
jgi:ferredoxin